MNKTKNDFTTTDHIDIDIDIDNIVDAAANDDDGDDACYDSSDDEAIIDRMKLATKESNKKKSIPRSTSTATAAARSVCDKSN